MDRALEARIDALTNSGLVNATANRAAIRAGQEPLDLFREYMALFSVEQARCHLSPALSATWRCTGMHAGAASDPRIWDQAETLPPEQLRALQLGRLRATVKRILDGQPFGAQRLAAAGLGAPEAIGSLDDLARLPFTSKADLRAHYPFGLLAVGREQIVRVHASSGTHGQPTVIGYTRADLENPTELMARCMTMAGVTPGMTVHNANGYGLFSGGLGFHQGGERIGATVVPVSGGFTARQLLLLYDLGAQVLVSTPSYALAIAQAIAEAGPTGLRLELGLFGGEPWTEAMRDQIEQALGLTAVNFYGLSEMRGPGVAAECPARAGLHVQEDHFAVEVIGPGGRPPALGPKASSCSPR